MSHFFTSGGQSIRVSASASVLSMNIQDWFPLGWTGWIFSQSKGLSRVFINTTSGDFSFPPVGSKVRTRKFPCCILWWGKFTLLFSTILFAVSMFLDHIHVKGRLQSLLWKLDITGFQLSSKANWLQFSGFLLSTQFCFLRLFPSPVMFLNIIIFNYAFCVSCFVNDYSWEAHRLPVQSLGFLKNTAAGLTMFTKLDPEHAIELLVHSIKISFYSTDFKSLTHVINTDLDNGCEIVHFSHPRWLTDK